MSSFFYISLTIRILSLVSSLIIVRLWLGLKLLLVLLKATKACMVLRLLATVLNWIHLIIILRKIILLSFSWQLTWLYLFLLSIKLVPTSLIWGTKAITHSLEVLAVALIPIYLWLNVWMIFLIVLESNRRSSRLSNCRLGILSVFLGIIAVYRNVICILLLLLLLRIVKRTAIIRYKLFPRILQSTARLSILLQLLRLFHLLLSLSSVLVCIITRLLIYTHL